VSEKAETTAAPTAAGLRLTFAPGQSDLSPDSTESIKALTVSAPPGDGTTFNVQAYAPGTPDDPSTARRVSLSRAMAVRSALVADGVPSARIFVRALGAQHGDGPADRVDLSIEGATQK
jgi:outer membrane protein OmpA-like peptidoglycan-associated protein